MTSCSRHLPGSLILSPINIFSGDRISDPGKCLEHDVMFLLMSSSITRLSTDHELFLLIVKMIPEDISVVVKNINIIRVVLHILKGVEEYHMFIIKTLIIGRK